jgi:hypothetical protein
LDRSQIPPGPSWPPLYPTVNATHVVSSFSGGPRGPDGPGSPNGPRSPLPSPTNPVRSSPLSPKSAYASLSPSGSTAKLVRYHNGAPVLSPSPSPSLSPPSRAAESIPVFPVHPSPAMRHSRVYGHGMSLDAPILPGPPTAVVLPHGAAVFAAPLIPVAAAAATPRPTVAPSLSAAIPVAAASMRAGSDRHASPESAGPTRISILHSSPPPPPPQPVPAPSQDLVALHSRVSRGRPGSAVAPAQRPVALVPRGPSIFHVTGRVDVGGVVGGAAVLVPAPLPRPRSAVMVRSMLPGRK